MCPPSLVAEAGFLAVDRAEMVTVLVGISVPRLPLRLGGSPACAAEEPVGLWPLLCRPSLCFGAEADVRGGAVVAAGVFGVWWSGLLLSVGGSRWRWLVRGRRSTGCVPGRVGQLLIGSCFAGGNCGSQSHWAMVFLPPLLLCPAASSGSGGDEVRRGAKTLEGTEATKVLSVVFAFFLVLCVVWWTASSSVSSAFVCRSCTRICTVVLSLI